MSFIGSWFAVYRHNSCSINSFVFKSAKPQYGNVIILSILCFENKQQKLLMCVSPLNIYAYVCVKFGCESTSDYRRHLCKTMIPGLLFMGHHIGLYIKVRTYTSIFFRIHSASKAVTTYERRDTTQSAKQLTYFLT